MTLLKLSGAAVNVVRPLTTAFGAAVQHCRQRRNFEWVAPRSSDSLDALRRRAHHHFAVVFNARRRQRRYNSFPGLFRPFVLFASR